MTDFIAGFMVNPTGALQTTGAGIFGNLSVTSSTLPTVGLFAPAANQLGFVTNSAQQMVIDASGNLGIGTTSPGYKLDVNGGLRVGGATPNTVGTNVGLFNAGIATFCTYNWNYGEIQITRTSSNSNPNKLLDFLFDGDTNANTTVGGTNAIWAFTNATPTTGSTTSGLQAGLIYGAYYGHRWNVNGTESMRIASNGYVGIGTNNPSSALNVWGRISVPVLGANGDMYFGNNGRIFDDGNFHIEGSLSSGSTWINANNGADLNLNQQGTGNAYLVNGGGSVGVGTTSVGGRFTVRGNTNDNATIDIKNNNTNYWRLWNDNGNNYLNLQYNGTTRWSITGSGTLSQTAAAGTYTIDVTNGSTSVANGGTVNFPNASGMLIVNNYSSGGVTIYLCGGGVTTAVSSVVGQVGTFAYNSGITGYTWTSNYGSTATYGFFFLRTRPTA